MSAPTARPEVTLGDVLAIAPADERLPTPVLALIAEDWGDRDALAIAAMNTFTTARELLAVMPDPHPGDADHAATEGYSNEDRFGAAEAIQALLKRAGLTAPVAAPAAPGTQRLQVEFPKTPSQMSLRELLAILAGDPSQYGELREHLDPKVRAAARKGPWAIAAPGGGLDVDMTVAYVAQLSKPHASAQRLVKGRRPARIGAVLGLDERALIHPFTGYPVQGPDGNGFDFAELVTLHPGLNEALLWAQVTGHSAWPATMDLYTYSEQVFQETLPRRWQLILDDYQAAVAAGEDSTRLITRFWPEGLSLETAIDIASGLTGSAPAPARRAAAIDYEQVVMEKAGLAGTLDAVGSDNRYSGGAYVNVRVVGSDNRFNGVVFVRGGQITGSDNSGSIMLPPGVRVRIVGSDNRIDQRNMTWKDLAEYLGLI